jgi:hypothetical protein
MTQTETHIEQPPIDITGPATDDLQLFSVTTIIGILEKRGLLYWSAELAAEAAIDSEQTWKAMLAERGRPEAVTWIRDAFNRRPKTALAAADLGTTVHKCCEYQALSGQQPTPDFIADQVRKHGTATTDVDAETAVVEAMMEQYDNWCQQFQPEYLAAEMTVYNPSFGFAGTLDAVTVIDGVRFITDTKTSREAYDKKGQPRGPYPRENGLQLAAYRYAEFAAAWRPRRFEKNFRRYYALGPTELESGGIVKVPEVDTGLVVFITPEFCHAYPTQCGEEAFRAFGHCLEMFRWAEITSPTIQSPPLEPTHANH